MLAATTVALRATSCSVFEPTWSSPAGSPLTINSEEISPSGKTTSPSSSQVPLWMCSGWAWPIAAIASCAASSCAAGDSSCPRATPLPTSATAETTPAVNRAFRFLRTIEMLLSLLCIDDGDSAVALGSIRDATVIAPQRLGRIGCRHMAASRRRGHRLSAEIRSRPARKLTDRRLARTERPLTR